ncbi:MAG TPA: hypothetical protein VHW09_23805 [Bryobacteraceae bacterium]|jgi:hypothetical protein|nr:hypothetical protein [Bryobacteraceae bacterium]
MDFSGDLFVGARLFQVLQSGWFASTASRAGFVVTLLLGKVKPAQNCASPDHGRHRAMEEVQHPVWNALPG